MRSTGHSTQHHEAIERELRATDPDQSLTVEIEALLRRCVGVMGEKMPGGSLRDVATAARVLGALLAYLGGTGGKKESIEDFLRRLDAEARE